MQPTLSALITYAVEHSYDGMMLADSFGNVVYFNSSYKKLTELDESVIKPGVNMQTLVDNGIIDGSTCMDAIRTKKVSVDVHATKHGTIVANSTPIMNAQGEVEYVVTNVLDGSEYANLAKRINRVEKKMNQLASSFALAAGTPSRGIIAVSKLSRECLRSANAMATYDMPILISGEVGVGKTTLAIYIHDHSNRAEKPLIKIACGTLDDDMLSEELFGSVGDIKKTGKLAAAEGGTILMNNVDELSLSMQAKLLRVVHTGMYRPVGSNEDVKTNVRFIFTSSISIRPLVDAGKFRSDLYYRISVLNLQIFPLRDRKEDIYPLCLFFLDHYNKKYNTRRKINPASMQILEDYSWPGNSREIRNTIEEMVITGTGDYLTVPKKIIAQVYGQNGDTDNSCFDTLAEHMDKRERDYLMKVYSEVGTTRKMAEVLDVNHSTIMRKLKKYGIHLSGAKNNV